MRSTTRALFVFSLALTVYSSATLKCDAEEITGKITSVNENQIVVVHESEFAPKLNDKVDIFVVIPGVGEAEVGKAKVTGVEDQTVTAEITDATGDVVIGQQVRIHSLTPGSRSTSPETHVQPSTGGDSQTSAEPSQPAAVSAGSGSWLGARVTDVDKRNAITSGLHRNRQAKTKQH